MKIPMENSYYCNVCHNVTITVDVANGVTPMFIDCLATPDCKGMAASAGYPRTKAETKPSWEWYKPAKLRGLSPSEIDHVELGGLLLRKRTAAAPIYHEEGQ